MPCFSMAMPSAAAAERRGIMTCELRLFGVRLGVAAVGGGAMESSGIVMEDVPSWFTAGPGSGSILSTKFGELTR